MSENKEETELLEKVRQMAKLTILSNRINEVQTKNLEMYPFVFFEGVKSAKIKYDFSVSPMVNTEEDSKNLQIQYNLKNETKNFKVIYYLDVDSSIENNNLEKRFAMLDSSIANLFWTGIVVEVYFNNTLAYKSKQDV